MKKNTKILPIIVIIAVVALYLVSAIFSLGTVFAPATALKTVEVNPDREQTIDNAFVTVDLSLRKVDEEDSEKTSVTSISRIYVYVGEVRSFATDEEGNNYAEIRFQFKTKSVNDGTAIRDEVIAKIPVTENSGGFSWIKVFDGELEAKKKEISYERVKISTPDSIDLYEVVFTDAEGYVLATDATYGIESQIEEARLVIDEQNMFTESTAKKYHFTNEELKALASVNALKGAKASVGSAPLATIAYCVSTFIFGTNTFGLRIIDCLSGLGIILIAYAFALNVFGKEKYGATAMISVLSLGAAFTASNFAFASLGAFFAVLSIYLASIYFIRHYYLEDKKDGVVCLIGIGLAYGLAVACNMTYCVLLIGLTVLLVMARKRGYKQFKRDEKQAKGLDKEEVYLSYNKKRLISFGVSALALTVLPIVLFTVCYSVCAGVYTEYYGAGYFASAFKFFVESITPRYQSSPFALFAGFGGIKFNAATVDLKYLEQAAYYSFLNYFTCIFSLVCFVFVTVAVFFGKKISFFKNAGVLSNKYKVTTVAFLSTAIPVFLGFISSPYGFASVSVFACAYIAFAQSVLVKCINKKAANTIFCVANAIGLIMFAMAYVAYVGFVLPELANKILYLWQVL